MQPPSALPIHMPGRLPWGLPLLVGMVLFLAGCSSRADVVLMLDSSRSAAAHRSDQVRVVSQVLNHLNPGQDHVSIYRLSNKVEVLYSGDPAPRSIGPVLNAYLKVESSEYGTAYGSALRTGVDELRRLHAKHQEAGEQGRAALLLLGDAADEPIRGSKDPRSRMTDDLLRETSHRLPETCMLAFLFAEPRWSNRIYSQLSAPLGVRLLLAPPPSAMQPGTLMQVFSHLQR